VTSTQEVPPSGSSGGLVAVAPGAVGNLADPKPGELPRRLTDVPSNVIYWQHRKARITVIIQHLAECFELAPISEEEAERIIRGLRTRRGGITQWSPDSYRP
jgi:hypothetical protein